MVKKKRNITEIKGECKRLHSPFYTNATRSWGWFSVRITFQTQETEKQQENIKGTQQGKTGCQRTVNRQGKAESFSSAALLSGSEDSWLYSFGNIQEKRGKKGLEDLQQEAGCMDIGNRRDYMTVVSHTMSQEDFAELQKEGFHFESMDPETAVTIVDKIKAELARSGQHIAGYTDDLDVDTLAAAVGSDALARAISDSFHDADIPMTRDNLDNVKRAWDMAAQLKAPGDGANHYMIDNQATPEIWNFYVAQSSGAEKMTGGTPRYYAEDIQGYFTQSANVGSAVQTGGNTQDGLQRQIDKVIAEAGLAVTDEVRQNADWLLGQGLPLNAENLLCLRDIQSVSFPLTEEVFAQAAATAILNGQNPIHGNLADRENIYAKAAVFADRFWEKAEGLYNLEDITTRRQLEEIRLRMTAEVNVKLLKSGFSIDTAPMEEFLQALKEAEEQLAESYFPKDAQAMEKYQLYRETTQTLVELPSVPVQVVGSWSVREENGTLAQFHGEGKALQVLYDKAQESYEALMTAPRADMGDSIRKAFANVDAILEDLGVPVIKENQRATRILGYNRMEMTVENIERVRRTDEQVRSVISEMTPAATLRMIRDGVNPLEMSFEELENYFVSQPQEYEESAENYSRFLYHLEQNKEISPAEREAYIGIYRMLRQIEKSDGAVIGAVVNTGAELQFANLLSAVRTGKFRHMDVKVTDETGLMQDLVREGKSISGQINDGLMAVAKEIVTEVSSDKEVDIQYNKMQLEQIRRAAEMQAESHALLDGSSISANVENLLAARELLKDFASPYKKWREKAREMEPEDALQTVESMARAENLLAFEEETVFAENYRNVLQEIKADVEQVTLENADNSVDVKELQLIHKQLSVMSAMSESQEYILPMHIGDEVGHVHLTLVSDEEQKGTVSIEVNWAENLHVEAYLYVEAQRVGGYLVGNTAEEVTKLQKAADIFHELLNEDTSANWYCGDLPVVSKTTDMSGRAVKGGLQEKSLDTMELYRVARMFLQAIKE